MPDPQLPGLFDPASYVAPDKECDLVMKGGITSGVIYPLAVCRLATQHTLRQVGGTSAGAIAAAAAAAAEHGRDTGAFVKLAELPSWLAAAAPAPATGSNLLNLFRPDDVTRKTYEIFMALVERRSPSKKIGTLVGRAVAAHPLPGMAGATPGIALAAAGALLGGGAVAPALASGSLLALIGLLGGVTAGAVTHALGCLPDNGFGLCRGLSAPGQEGPEALTDWLSSTLDAMAGMPPSRPLTFGDLQAKGIRLRMLTTSLTHGLPYRLPFDNRMFHYDSAELRALFPEYVVDHMDANAEVPSRPLRTPEGTELLHLPVTERFPVVVAARMSLSFPLLISAVPLWAVDYGSDDLSPQRNWFSDGGITSNFPVHFFDALLPSRPTFALNLGPTTSVDPDNQTNNIVVPSRAGAGVLPRWTDIRGLVDFVRAILDTMQNWSDNNQARLPGYRDRVIRILHTDEEGGINLDMDSDRLDALSARGEAAALELLRFDLAQHRWTRYRSSMALIERTLNGLVKSYGTHVPDVPSYGEMIDDPPQSYSNDWSAAKAEFGRTRTEALMELGQTWPDGVHRFDDENAPRPAPTLRVTPDV